MVSLAVGILALWCGGYIVGCAIERRYKWVMIVGLAITNVGAGLILVGALAIRG